MKHVIQYKTFKRFFTNYGEFGTFEEIMFLDSVAVMVQEFLYKRKYDAQRYYLLDGLITLYDFMSLEAIILLSMSHELGLAVIKDTIRDLQQERPGYDECEIEYVHDAKDMVVYNASDRLIIPLLWTAYIYACARYTVEKDSKFKDASDMYYQLLFEQSYYTDELMKECYPIKYCKEATDMLIRHISMKCKEILKKEREKEESSQVEKDEKTALLDKIKKQDSELEEKNEQIEMVRNREKGISLGINQAQTALFGLSLANVFGFNYTNKKEDLAPLLHALFGWGEAKIAFYLSTPCDDKERDELANLFKDLCPPLYATIMNRGELPPGVTPFEEKVIPSKG